LFEAFDAVIEEVVEGDCDRAVLDGGEEAALDLFEEAVPSSRPSPGRKIQVAGPPRRQSGENSRNTHCSVMGRPDPPRSVPQ
jgi:hypothetical protein